MQTKSEIMKRLFVILALVAMVFSACNNKVDLYSNEGDSTVVYAMLDPFVDTNFFKITHSFIGNTSTMAHDYNANNYEYDELEVTFTGVFKDSPATQTLLLDTISKWIPYNPESAFYSGCYQRYYYTTKKLLEGKEYTLNILRKKDNVNVSATASMINEFIFQKPATSTIGFTEVETTVTPVEWRTTAYPFKSTASYFEVTSYFRYSELMPGKQDTVHRTIQWNMGSGEADNLYNTNVSLPYYALAYAPSALYKLLEKDEYLKNNSPLGVQRFFEDFRFTITASGEEMYNYYLVNHSSSAIQDVPNYSNIDNGIGLMSSRVTIIKDIPIEIRSRQKIRDKFPLYGFYVDPNR